MLKSIPKIRAFDPPVAGNGQEQRVGSRQEGFAAQSAPAKHTTRQRFLKELGVAAMPVPPRAFSQQLKRPADLQSSLLSAKTGSSPAHPVTDNLARLHDELANQLQNLPATESDRYKRFLSNASLCTDPARQVLLLNLLGASITTTFNRLQSGNAGLVGTPQSMWDQLAGRK